MDGRSLQRELEEDRIAPDEALPALATAARDAPTSGLRLDACRVIGALSGRAYGASWDVAERAAFVLLEVARDTDAPAERAQLLSAMGRGFRNAWLVPYVHARLGDDDELVVSAAISAAGGLAFPALEETIAGFLSDDAPRALRLAAIAALGRMGAESTAARIAKRAGASAAETAYALSALMEIRSRAGEEAAVEVLRGEPEKYVRIAAVRYLAELGNRDVLRSLRRMARDDDAELRIAASLASRAFRAETTRDAEERILAALTERDRAVRSALARRLRTLPANDVLEHAEILLADDPEGVVQILAEVRAPEVTTRLLALAADPSVTPSVRARAAGSIEADEAWERDALLALVRDASCEDTVRVAAAQTIGAFAPVRVVLDQLSVLAGDRSPALRGALLWALQLAARPRDLGGEDRARAEAILARALEDEDPTVRRRAAYVAGNLDSSALVPALIELVRGEPERSDLRIAGFVGLGEIGSSERAADVVHLFNREDDPAALGAAARAIERSGAKTQAIGRARDRLPKLIASNDARVRAAGARVAGLVPDAVPIDRVVELASDGSPRVREQAVGALGRLGGRAAEKALAEALDDADPVVQERAADGLLARSDAACTARVIELVSRAADHEAARRIASRIAVPPDPEKIVPALGAALSRIAHDHPAYEPLLELKLGALEAIKPAGAGDVDAAIAQLFPMWTRLRAVRGFAPLARSLRTAETLYGVTTADADQSGAIVLWTKSLEGYLHAWLAPRLAALQQNPGDLFALVDKVTGSAWPSYQRWLAQRWQDPVDVGGLSVELPLRSVVNALREIGERRMKSLDSPMAITEWARMMLFLAVDHPAGPRNLLGVSAKDAEKTVKLAHRLQLLAHVRNAVTHRSVATRATLEGFRTLYYPAFEELTSMA